MPGELRICPYLAIISAPPTHSKMSDFEDENIWRVVLAPLAVAPSPAPVPWRLTSFAVSWVVSVLFVVSLPNPAIPTSHRYAVDLRVGNTLAVWIYENLVGNTLAVWIYENLVWNTVAVWIMRTSCGTPRLLDSRVPRGEHHRLLGLREPRTDNLRLLDS
ncbi:hypothetical protein EV702DRAFT_1192119 [Suillus placidus]|uniref:Uncharacterized protein n=1 Tax=Suillus placidus TaxID=48579 RepID=A0A9P7D7M1_9AGAM|nr:hypothetical protein EV702DRAFT_1192119 [Suillus placidus]